jgi:hypothetical protein
MNNKWYDVEYDYPVMWSWDRIKWERKMRVWFTENNIDEWHTLRDSNDRMIGFSFLHKKDAVLFTLKWL